MHRYLYALALVGAITPGAAFATTVHRCVDGDGHVTFTHLGCPSDQQLHLQTAENPTPSGATPPAPGKAENARKQTFETAPQRRAITGTAERQDGCGNRVSGSARRKAMINKEVRAGMTQADVQSMLGKPDAISSQNGNVRYNYVDKHTGRKRSVSFDSEGCVKS